MRGLALTFLLMAVLGKKTSSEISVVQSMSQVTYMGRFISTTWMMEAV